MTSHPEKRCVPWRREGRPMCGNISRCDRNEQSHVHVGLCIDYGERAEGGRGRRIRTTGRVLRPRLSGHFTRVLGTRSRPSAARPFSLRSEQPASVRSCASASELRARLCVIALCLVIPARTAGKGPQGCGRKRPRRGVCG